MDEKMQCGQVIVSDLDGVLSDFYLPATKLLKQFYGKPELPIRGVDAQTWGFQSLGISTEQENEFWGKISEVENFWLKEPEIIEGIVQEFWERIGNNNLQRTVYFCTTRGGTLGMSVEDQSAYWLAKNGWLKYPHIIVTKHKGLICKALKADYFVDDKASNVIDVMKASPETHSFFLLSLYQKDELEEVMRVHHEFRARLTVITSIYDFIEAVERES